MSTTPFAAIESFWTEDAVATLRKLKDDGESSSRIAEALGTSRNAVIGKAARLGIGGGRHMAARLPPARTPADLAFRVELARQRRRDKYIRAKLRGLDRLTAPQFAPDGVSVAEAVENIIPLGQRCTLLDLTDAKCHWPVGDPGTPDFFFCGGKPDSGKPYCGYHCCVAYQPPPSRRHRAPFVQPRWTTA